MMDVAPFPFLLPYYTDSHYDDMSTLKPALARLTRAFLKSDPCHLS